MEESGSLLQPTLKLAGKEIMQRGSRLHHVVSSAGLICSLSPAVALAEEADTPSVARPKPARTNVVTLIWSGPGAGIDTSRRG